ncbi:ovochymase-1 [Eurytemora carolleeae]|uniref:ovochymase-1 n=1 Tax=Eurytemora carolleeae TaxID=1294199 RepID=UPI000C7591AC|nr:ovochymase-1 [Eurytemora carolleeae]|eukprot:XP_023340029.1 ovochymase-1-like [Eurytemora affinis]
MQQMEVVGGIDERSGVYILDEDATTAADFYNQNICQSECIYRRRHDTTGELFCFGFGSLTSECADCGISNILPKPRIQNGKPTGPNKYPWMVFVITILKTGDMLTCGGSLINKQYVITAAHCTIAAEQISVTLSENDFEADDGEKNVQVCDNPLEHPGYNDSDFMAGWDIAIIKLCNPVRFSQTVSPVCLPSMQSEGTEFENLDAIVTGWGITSPSSNVSNLLLEAEVRTLSNADCCNPDKGHLYDCPFPDSLICAVGDGEAGACVGDSGGPLMIRNSNGVFTIFGIVSGGNAFCTKVYIMQ